MLEVVHFQCLNLHDDMEEKCRVKVGKRFYSTAFRRHISRWFIELLHAHFAHPKTWMFLIDTESTWKGKDVHLAANTLATDSLGVKYKRSNNHNG